MKKKRKQINRNLPMRQHVLAHSQTQVHTQVEKFPTCCSYTSLWGLAFLWELNLIVWKCWLELFLVIWSLHFQGFQCLVKLVFYRKKIDFNEILWCLSQSFVLSIDCKKSIISLLCGLSRYLVTTFKVVPRGTEGAVSAEGTLAGLLASILLASVGCLMGEVLFIILSLIMHNQFYCLNDSLYV